MDHYEYDEQEMEHYKVYSESHAHWNKVFNIVMESFYTDISSAIGDLIDKEFKDTTINGERLNFEQKQIFVKAYLQAMHEIKKIIRNQITLKKEIYDFNGDKYKGNGEPQWQL